MVGTFRALKDDDEVFYEFWVIEVEDGKAIFKMKHFDRGLHGWEEKADSFVLPSLSAVSRMCRSPNRMAVFRFAIDEMETNWRPRCGGSKMGRQSKIFFICIEAKDDIRFGQIESRQSASMAGNRM